MEIWIQNNGNEFVKIDVLFNIDYFLEMASCGTINWVMYPVTVSLCRFTQNQFRQRVYIHPNPYPSVIIMFLADVVRVN
jgi:hypothetical protein